LDGTRTLEEIAFRELDDGTIDPGATVQFVDFLHRGGFLEDPWVDTYGALAARLKPARTRLLDRAWARMRTMTIPFPGADRFIDALYDRGGRFVFATPVLALIGVVFAGGLAAFFAES